MILGPICNFLKNSRSFALTVLAGVISGLVASFYTIEKQRDLDFYKEFLNTISSYSEIFIVLESFSKKQIATDLEIATLEHNIVEALEKVESMDTHKLEHLCITSPIYSKNLSIYCNNIVSAIYARKFTTNEGLYLGNDENKVYLSSGRKRDFTENTIQQLLTYNWEDAYLFKKTDPRHIVTLDFINFSERCYTFQECSEGIDRIASGADYLTLLILYSNYKNIIDTI